MKAQRMISGSLAVWLALTGLAWSREIEGVNIPTEKAVAGETVRLNGAGVRTVKLGFFPIKAYVASFYAPSPVGSEAQAVASPGPLQFHFTFLHGVGQGQVTEAWDAQFKTSVTHIYPELAADQKKFVAMFGPLKKGGTQTVEFVGDETRVYDGAALKGTIPGRDFQKAFLSLWFGTKPAEASLKANLLGK